MSPYRKFFTSLVGAIVAFATLVLTSEPVAITGSEWLSGAITLATALGVYQVRNDDPIWFDVGIRKEEDI